MKILLFLFISLFCLPANAEVYKISMFDGGGSLKTYVDKYTQIAQSGEDIAIDAPCISACTAFLGLVPLDRVCVTPRASLGFHLVTVDDKPDVMFSEIFYRWVYPEWVQKWIKDHGGLQSDPIYMFAEDLKGHIKLCSGSGSYNNILPEDLIHHEQPSPLPPLPPQ